MDFSILYAIQTLRGPVMDALILGLTNIMGSYGQIWLVVGVALCLFPKTRRCGVAVGLAAWAVAAAASGGRYFKKPGAVLLAVAALIGFSRMYLFVHFPTDVLFGAVLGAALAVLTVWALNRLCDWLAARRAAQNGGGNPQA